jgi:polysaccharide export outer membrane protein
MPRYFRPALALLAVAAPLCSGCQPLTVRGQNPELSVGPKIDPGVTPAKSEVPTEKAKTTLPTYVIEPPDILLIDALKLIPKPPYHIESQDLLQITVMNTLLDQPINGPYRVDAEGTVNLGPAYGKVKVGGLTSEEATAAIDKHLRDPAGPLRGPEVSVTITETSGLQMISGEHLVGPDGMVNLGTYGTVYVAGMTIAEAHVVIEKQLGKFLQEPKIAVDVYAYNSKVYYVLTEGAGSGDTLLRVPATGNETVLDAIAQVNGLSRLSSKHIWIARPAAGGGGCDQILPVNWDEITKGGATATNYQVLPGDRIFIAQDNWIALDSWVNRVTAPFERLFGFSLLGSQTIQTMNRFPLGLTSGGGGGI